MRWIFLKWCSFIMFSSCIRCLHVHVNHSKKCFRVRAFAMDLKKWAGLEVGWWWWTVLNNYVPEWKTVLNNYVPKWTTVLNDYFPEWKTVLNNYVPEWPTVLNYVPECKTVLNCIIIETTWLLDRSWPSFLTAAEKLYRHPPYQYYNKLL